MKCDTRIYTVRNLINNLISMSYCNQQFQRNGCKYKIQYYWKKEAARIEYPAIKVSCNSSLSNLYNNTVIYAIKKVVRTVLFVITCSFSVFVENCILLPKGIDEFVVFLCIVHVWFWFVILLPRFVLLVIKGQFFPEQKFCFRVHFSFQVQKCSIEIFLSE